VAPVIWMIVGSVAAALGAIALGAAQGATLAGPVFGGMIGPLAAAVGTWVVVARTHRRDPGAVFSVMVAAFPIKLVFFAVYTVAMVKGFRLDARLFGLSFAAFFIALYAVEAALLSRRFGRAPQGAR
jgi:hypothetical protein